MNFNFMQILQTIKNGQNPQQLIMSILQGQNSNPIIKNATDLAQKGDTSALQMIARNIAQQRGIDYDSAW